MGFKKSAEMKKLFCSLSLLAVVTTTSCSYICVVPPRMPTPTGQDSIDRAVEQAQELRDAYVEHSRKKIASLPFYNLPLLGAAGAGIGGLLFNSHPDFVAIAGLAGGSVAGIKTVLNPAAIATAYIDGTKALDCVIESAKPLMSENRKSAEGIADDLRPSKAEGVADGSRSSKIDTVEEKLSTLRRTRRNKQVSSDLMIPAYKAESDATAAVSAAQDALGAFDKVVRDASVEVPIQVSTIHAKVSKKILNTQNVSFSDLQAAITGTITSITQQKAAIDAIRKNLEEIQPTPQTAQKALATSITEITELNLATSALKAETRKLLNVIPNFKEALERTKMCAAAL